MQHLPIYVYGLFILTVIIAFWIIIKASGVSKSFMVVLLCWIIIQTVLSVAGFYVKINAIPPRLPFLLLPPLIVLVVLFSTHKGKRFIDRFSLKALTLFHVIRIPVEIVLYWLFLNKGVPALLTFEGRNFDIISGLTAPIIFYWGL